MQPPVETLPAEQLPPGHFIVSPDVLVSHIWQVCEMVLNIPLNAVNENPVTESMIASSSIVTTAAMNQQQRCLLVIKCDDTLLETVFTTNPSSPNESNLHIKTLNLLSRLADIISNEITAMFRGNQQVHFPSAPRHAKHGAVAEVLLKHASGCLQIVLTALEGDANTPLSSPTVDNLLDDIGA